MNVVYIKMYVIRYDRHLYIASLYLSHHRVYHGYYLAWENETALRQRPRRRKDKTTGTYNSGFSYLHTVLVQRQDLVVQVCWMSTKARVLHDKILKNINCQFLGVLPAKGTLYSPTFVWKSYVHGETVSNLNVRRTLESGVKLSPPIIIRHLAPRSIIKEWEDGHN